MTAKNYELRLDKNLWRVRWLGGGQISPQLAGEYTSQRSANLAIENYEASKIPSRQAKRKVVDGESEATS